MSNENKFVENTIYTYQLLRTCVDKNESTDRHDDFNIPQTLFAGVAIANKKKTESTVYRKTNK